MKSPPALPPLALAVDPRRMQKGVEDDADLGALDFEGGDANDRDEAEVGVGTRPKKGQTLKVWL